MVKKNRILTTDNLIKKDWQGDSRCVFCNENESEDHLFVSCIVAQRIWQWIAAFNGFQFTGTTIQDLWYIDACVSLKDVVS